MRPTPGRGRSLSVIAVGLLGIEATRIAASGVRFGLPVGDNTSPSGSPDDHGDLGGTGPSTRAVLGPAGWSAAGNDVLRGGDGKNPVSAGVCERTARGRTGP